MEYDLLIESQLFTAVQITATVIFVCRYINPVVESKYNYHIYFQPLEFIMTAVMTVTYVIGSVVLDHFKTSQFQFF